MTRAELRSEAESVGVERFTASDYGTGPVTHIVLFRYAATTTAAEREEVARRFHALAATQRDGTPYIRSIRSGPQGSGEIDRVSWEHAFVVEFASLGDRNFYVGEPVVDDPRFFDAEHATFKTWVGPLLAEGGALVFDFQGD